MVLLAEYKELIRFDEYGACISYLACHKHVITSQHFGSFPSLYILGIHGIRCVVSGKPRRMSETTPRGSAGTRRVPSETTIFLAFQSPRSWGNSMLWYAIWTCTPVCSKKNILTYIDNDYQIIVMHIFFYTSTLIALMLMFVCSCVFWIVLLLDAVLLWCLSGFDLMFCQIGWQKTLMDIFIDIAIAKGYQDNKERV